MAEVTNDMEFMDGYKFLSEEPLRLVAPPPTNWQGTLLDTNVSFCIHSTKGFGFVRRFFWRVCFGVHWTKV
jgi:hypothetical protein